MTGSSSGIGLGIAKSLAKKGCGLAIHGLEPQEQIAKIAQSLSQEFGVPAMGFSADLTQSVQVDRLISEATNGLQGLDILVNNAGFQFVASVEEFPPEKWRQLLEIHLTVPFLIAQKILPDLRKKKWGRIINIASAHGLVASANKSAYVAAKHGLVGFTKALALETANSGITCNAICPGWVKTPLVESQIEKIAERDSLSIPEATAKLLGEKQPLTSFTSVDQLGDMAAFLCSDSASSMTASILSMDGGWTAH